MKVTLLAEGFGSVEFEVSDQIQECGPREEEVFARVGACVAQIVEKSRTFGGVSRMIVVVAPGGVQ